MSKLRLLLTGKEREKNPKSKSGSKALQPGNLGEELDRDPEEGLYQSESKASPSSTPNCSNKEELLERMQDSSKTVKTSSKPGKVQPETKEMTAPVVLPATKHLQNLSKLRTNNLRKSQEFEEMLKRLDFENPDHKIVLEELLSLLKEFETLRGEVIETFRYSSGAAADETNTELANTVKTLVLLRFSLLKRVNEQLIKLANQSLEIIKKETTKGALLDGALGQKRGEIERLEIIQKELVGKIKPTLGNFQDIFTEINSYILEKIKAADDLLLQNRNEYFDKLMALSIKLPPQVTRVDLAEIKGLPLSAYKGSNQALGELLGDVEALELLNSELISKHVPSDSIQACQQRAKELYVKIQEVFVKYYDFLNEDDKRRIQAVLDVEDARSQKDLENTFRAKLSELKRLSTIILNWKLDYYGQGGSTLSEESFKEFSKVFKDTQSMLQDYASTFEEGLCQQGRTILEVAEGANQIAQQVLNSEEKQEESSVSNAFEAFAPAPLLRDQQMPRGEQEFKRPKVVPLPQDAFRDDIRMSAALRDRRRQSASDLSLCAAVFTEVPHRMTKENAFKALLRVGIHPKVVQGSAQDYDCIPSEIPKLMPQAVQNKRPHPPEGKLDDLMAMGGNRGLVKAILAGRDEGMQDLDMCNILFTAVKNEKITLVDVMRACHISGIYNTMREAALNHGISEFELLVKYSQNINAFNRSMEERNADDAEEKRYMTQSL